MITDAEKWYCLAWKVYEYYLEEWHQNMLDTFVV